MKIIYRFGFYFFLPSIFVGIIFSIFEMPSVFSELTAKNVPLNDPKNLDMIDRVILGTFLNMAGIFLHGFWITGIVLFFIEGIKFLHSRKHLMFGAYVLICFLLIHFSTKYSLSYVISEEYWSWSGVRLSICGFITGLILFVLRPIIERIIQFSSHVFCLEKISKLFIHGEKKQYEDYDLKTACFQFKIPVFRRFALTFILSLFLSEFFSLFFLSGRFFDFFLAFFVIIISILNFLSIKFEILGQKTCKHLCFGRKRMTSILCGTTITPVLQVECLSQSNLQKSERHGLQIIRRIADENDDKVFCAFEIFIFGFDYLYLQMEIFVNLRRLDLLGK